MTDHSIPRRRVPDPNQRSGAPLSGWFVRLGNGKVVLQAYRGQTWPLRLVSILQGGWGSIDNSEGVSKLPRVREYDADGVVVVEGDKVVIEFLNGDKRRPLVRGGVRGVLASDFFPANSESSGANTNRLAMRLSTLDKKGKATGYIEFEAGHKNDASWSISTKAADNSPKDGPPVGPRGFISWSPGDVNGSGASLQIGLPSGEGFLMNGDQMMMMTATGHTFMMSEGGGVQWAQSNGKGGAESSMQAHKGNMITTTTGLQQIVAQSIEMSGGVTPPLDRYVKPTMMFPAWSAALLELVAVMAVPGPLVGPLPLPATTALAAALTASLGAGAPYLSMTIKGQ